MDDPDGNESDRARESRVSGATRLRQAALVAVLLGLLTYLYLARDRFPSSCGRGRSEELAGEKIVYLRGSPEEIGRQHGALLKWTIRKMLGAVMGYFRDVGARAKMYAGAAQMEPFIPADYVAEMKACAAGAGVPYPRT